MSIKDIIRLKFKLTGMEETSISLYNKGDQRCSVIFGRNGFGKTTISRAIEFIKEDSSSSCNIEYANFVSNDNEVIELSEIDKKNIFVFNEDYIHKNVLLEDNGLRTIAILGEDVALNEKVKLLQVNINDNNKKLIEVADKLAWHEDSANEGAVAFYRDRILKKLKGDNNWADRSRRINDKKIATSVNDDVINTIMRTKVLDTDNLLNLTEDFQCQLRTLEEVRTNSKKPIFVAVPIEILDRYSSAQIKNIKSLLCEEIVTPVFSEREKKLFNTLENYGGKFVDEIRKTFRNNSVEYCPFCLQSVSTDYKVDILSILRSVLNDKVAKHRKELKAAELPYFTFDYLEFSSIDNSLADKCRRKFEALNIRVRCINDLLNRKYYNPYLPIVDNIDLDDIIDDLKENFEKLENSRKVYNSTIEDKNKIRLVLNDINNKIAYLEIQSEYSYYISANSEVRKLREEQRECNKSNVNLEAEIGELKSKMTNTKIALELVNSSLRFLYFDSNRLQLEYNTSLDGSEKGGCYCIKVNGKNVKPSMISVGERNAIAVCYFFAQIAQKKEGNSYLQEKYFIVLDDPVSSFDFENMIGVMGVLSYSIGGIIRGNLDSKILLLTHDYRVFTCANDLFNYCYKEMNDKKVKSSFYSLENEEGTISTLSLNDGKNNSKICFNEYSNLMSTVYRFASGEEKVNSLQIGNMIRRLVEAFSTFEYNKGFDCMTDQMRLFYPNLCKYKHFYDSALSKLFLNDDSHMQNRVKSTYNVGTFPRFSEKEKVKCAKYMICMLYQLNKPNVISNIISKNNSVELVEDVENNIKSWLDEVENIIVGIQSVDSG